MSWRGGVWNEQDMKEDGRRGFTDMNQKFPNLPIPSFTSINQNQAPAPFPFISPLKTRHDRALDSDAFYDLAPEATPPAKSKGKRRESAAGINGHLISSTPIWAYHEEGDIPYQSPGVEVDQIPKKRQKLAPSKRSKSAKPPATTLNTIWDQEEVMEVTENESKRLTKTNPQLASPPDTEKRPAKRVEASKSANKGRQMGPFKNPVITKPKISPEPETQQKGDVATSRFVINHLGWTTTQEALKLSKTTLDRLAGFRYTHASSEQPLKAVDRNSSKHGQFDRALDGQEEPDTSKTSDHVPRHNAFNGDGQNLGQAQPQDFSSPADGYHLTQIQAQTQDLQYSTHANVNYHSQNYTFSDEAAWKSANRHGKSVEIPISTRHSQDQDTNTSNPSPIHHSRSQRGIETPTESGGQVQISGMEKPESAPQSGIHILETIHQSSNYGELTSSETRLMGEMAGIVCEDGYHAVQAPDSYSDPVSKNDGDLARVKFDVFNEPSVPHSLSHGGPKDVLEPTKGGSEEFDIDDFDDEINDDDLLGLELISNAQVEECGSSAQPQAGRILDIMPAPLPNRHANDMQIPTPLDQEEVRPIRMASSKLDDEYPLDDGDEAEMLNLQDYEEGVDENYQVPPSLNYGAHEDPASGQVFDRSLQFSPPNSRASMSPGKGKERLLTDHDSIDVARLPDKNPPDAILIENGEEWSFIHSKNDGSTALKSVLGSQERTLAVSRLKSQQSRVSVAKESDESPSKVTRSQPPDIDLTQSRKNTYTLDDSQEYEPLPPFARPDFPALMRDRSPIVGLSTQTFLRVCFRIGEMFKEGGRCEAMNQNAVIELYARVTFSSRGAGTTKQHFQFADLWHDRPPYPTGVLANYKSSGLAETESRVFVGATESIMARCLGTLKRHSKSANGWLLHVVSIRPTDWEEIRWTRRIVSAGLVKTERANL